MKQRVTQKADGLFVTKVGDERITAHSMDELKRLVWKAQERKRQQARILRKAASRYLPRVV